MAIWYELYLSCELDNDVPEMVIDVLKHYLIEQKTDPIPLPDHPFFDLTFQPSPSLLLFNDTAYFPGPPCAYLTKTYDDQNFELTTRLMARGSSGFYEIASFLHWLAPYCAKSGDDFMGHIRSDETQFHITLIYFDEGSAYLTSVDVDEDAPKIKRTLITESYFNRGF